MRKFAILSAVALASGLAATSNAATYNGNGATGFGGGIGNSVLTVTDGGSTVNFSITSTTNTFDGNPVAIYFDTVAGGDSSTSTYTDGAGDVGRTAISGFTTSGRTLVNFPAGFGADRASSAEIGSFAGLFNLSTPANFGFLESGGIAGSGTGRSPSASPRPASACRPMAAAIRSTSSAR